MNFKENDFLSCKTFAIQDCAVNWDSFVVSPHNRAIIEHMIIINTEVRSV